MKTLSALFVFLLLASAAAAQELRALAENGVADQNQVREGLQNAQPSPDPAWAWLLERLSEDGLDKKQLDVVFTRPEVRFDPATMGKKLRTLYKTKYLPRVAPPPGPHKTIWETWLTPEHRAEIAAFMKTNARALSEAEKRYGLPRQVVTAILMVETKLGRYCGERPALAVLASMAASRDYEVVQGYLAEFSPSPSQVEWLKMRQEQKADWAYDELKALLEHSWANRVDPVVVPGSIYGAIGLCQFMPTNVLKLGVDGDRDGKVDLFDPADAIHSTANYLKNAGWRKGLNRKGQIRVIMRYNHDLDYAGTVLAIAKRI